MEDVPASGDPTTTVQVLAVATDDTWAHVYPSVDRMLHDGNVGATEGHRGSLEFFDATGRRLAPVFAPGWQLRGLVATGDRRSPCELLQRLYAVVHHATSYVRRHPEVVEGSAMTPEEVIAGFPQLRGASLPEALELLDAAINPGITSHSAGWFHNALHAAGWTH